MHEPSEEQSKVVKAYNDNNIIADSVAGSGKTTTVLHIAKEYSVDNILLLTYNKKLRLETKRRADECNLDNLTVHNYHSFAVKYYNKKCHTDSEIQKYLNHAPLKQYRFTKIIIDEAQDMTQLYYQLVCKIINENIVKPLICILGDRYQSIYDFNGADNRYIIFGDKIFNINDKPWIKLKLSKTFRVPNEMTEFLNKCVLKNDRLISVKSVSIKPRYLFCDAFSKRPFTLVMNYLKTYKCDDIFILAPSVKNDKSPVKILANALSQNGVNIYIPVNDDEKLDEDIIRNKLVFSSFHQVKGLERAVIVIFYFDKGYFDFYNRSANPYNCTNALYVALTRSRVEMALIHHYEHDYLPFLNRELLYKYCQIDTIKEAMMYRAIHPKYINHFKVDNLFSKVLCGSNVRVIDAILAQTVKHVKSVTVDIDRKVLCKNIKSDIIDHALSYVNILTVNNPCHASKVIDLATKVKQKSSHESVCEINETAIPAYFQFMNTGEMEIVKYLNSNDFIHRTSVDYFKEDSDDEETIKDIIVKDITYCNMNIAKVLEISNKYNCSVNKVIHKLSQINLYEWIYENQMDLCLERLSKHITSKAKYKILCCATKRLELRGKSLNTVIDCIDGNNIYEFNCNNSISNKNLLECAVNMYIFNVHNEIKTFKTKDMVKLEIEYKNIDKQIEELYETKNIFSTKIKLLMKYKLNYNIQHEIQCYIDVLILRQHKIKELLTNVGQLQNFYLFNIGTYEIIELSSTMDNLTLMIEFLIRKKYYEFDQISDDEFIENRLEIFDMYF
jgi:DNA polymerase III delta prime subunit